MGHRSSSSKLRNSFLGMAHFLLKDLTDSSSHTKFFQTSVFGLVHFCAFVTLLFTI